MDMKKKLVEIFCSVLGVEPDFSNAEAMKFVEELISHGVTVQEWISVKDRLPKGGAIVLCNTDYFVEVLQWDELADMWVDRYQGYCKNYVTHWMPLPEPPCE